MQKPTTEKLVKNFIEKEFIGKEKFSLHLYQGSEHQ